MELCHQVGGKTLFDVHRVACLGVDDVLDLCHVLIRNVGQIFEERDNHGVGKRHRFTEDVVGRLVDADIVIQALAHLLDAVGAHQKRNEKALLGPLAHLLLEVAPHQQVEHLIGAAELHIGLYLHRIVCLEQWVEQLGYGNRLVVGEPLGEVIALEELGHCELTG